MGLSIDVGVLAFLQKDDAEGAEWLAGELVTVNEVLKENDLPIHNEPTVLPELVFRSNCGGFPYSFLHYLRRFYARAINDPDWIPTPVEDGEDPAGDEVVDAESNMFESHLLCHSDCEGFYLPVEFEDVLVSDNHEIAGGLLCSSYKLKEELVAIAPKLGINVVDGNLSDSEASKIDEDAAEQNGEFWIEKLVWLSLFEAARLSIEHKTAITFQ